MAEYEKTARERLSQAAFKILPGVGHVPTIDDPDLVARTILAVTTAACLTNKTSCATALLMDNRHYP
jgi:hypothetical protein